MSIRYQRCSKSPCVCDAPTSHGHGQIYSFSIVVNGKTKIKNYKLGPELDKLQKEIENYHTFRELSNDLIAISSQICDLRPVPQIGDKDALEELLNADGGDYRGRTITCGKGHDFEFIEYRDKKLLTVLGNMKVKRAYYYDKECKVGVCPKQMGRFLGIQGCGLMSTNQFVAHPILVKAFPFMLYCHIHA